MTLDGYHLCYITLLVILGASLEDLGKKLFRFTKMDKPGLRLLEKI